MNLLCDIKTGERIVVRHVKGRSSFKRRISEMGFVRGKEVLVVKNAPLHDPIEYKIMGYNVSLRRSEAALIEVLSLDEAKEMGDEYQGTLEFSRAEQGSTFRENKKINVVFVGNPNAGKTTLYNAMTGKQEHVGNYSGVTIDAKQATAYYNGYELSITDLPGTYSLSPNSPDEIFVREHLLKQHPDIVVNVIDASNLERNLYLTCQLIDMDIQMVLALNMFDELAKKDEQFDYGQFGAMIGVPMVPTVGSKRKGVDELLAKIVDVYENKDPKVRHIHINYGIELEQSINHIQREIWKAKNYVREFSSRYLAIHLIEQDSHTLNQIDTYDNSEEIKSVAKAECVRLETLCKDDTQTLVTEARYAFISGALKETLKTKQGKEKLSLSEKIDNVLTGRYTGFPIFLLILWIMFQSTFSLGQYPADLIAVGVDWLGNTLGSLMKSGPVRDLLVDGVIAGVGGVLVFLPNIVILFFFISLLEDTGYMSRVAFIMDRLMHMIGLHGKSFIPLIIGFGCNVPAIMATRTLGNRNDRLLTMLIVPFMSCSARLPVYILIAGAVFGSRAGTVIFFVYLVGILMSILTAILLKKIFFKSAEAPFVMELPPYRVPTLRSALRHMWHKAKEYLRKMTGVILWASIIIWFLNYFPRTSEMSRSVESQMAQIEQQKSVEDDKEIIAAYDQSLNDLNRQLVEIQQENSYIGRLGQAIEPVLRPLGFDWRIGVSLISGIAAKEVVVSTLSVLYTGGNVENDASLGETLRRQTYTSGPNSGSLIYTMPTTLALLVFILIYIPCIAVIGAIRKESGKLRWAIWNISYSLVLAWCIAFAVLHIAQFLV